MNFFPSYIGTIYFYPGTLLLLAVFFSSLVYFFVSWFKLRQEYRMLSVRHNEVRKQKEELDGLNQLKTKLFSVIAHDLRTPFISLKNMITLVKYNLPEDDEVPVFIKHISDDLNNKANLLDNLLHWARSQLKGFVPAPVSIEIRTIFEETILSFNDTIERKKIAVNNNIKPGACIFADVEMLRVIVRNLIANALKFTPENGTVIVDQKMDDGFLTIMVQDNGIGMSAEAVNRLFQNDFYSTIDLNNKKGTGLGLLLSKEFVERNNGKIWVESVPGKGSSFYFTLPAI